MFTRNEISNLFQISVAEVDRIIFRMRQKRSIRSYPTRIGGIALPVGGPGEPTHIWHYEKNSPSAYATKPNKAVAISREARNLLNILKKASRLLKFKEIVALGVALGINNPGKAIIELRNAGVNVLSFPTRKGGYGLADKGFVMSTNLYRFAA